MRSNEIRFWLGVIRLLEQCWIIRSGEKSWQTTNRYQRNLSLIRSPLWKVERYFWCACGRSAKQPFCDGSHSGTGIEPVAYKAEKSGDAWFCGCKATGNSPMCDGSHKNLGDDKDNG